MVYLHFTPGQKEQLSASNRSCKRRYKMSSFNELYSWSSTTPEAGISENYCATNSGSPKVDLRFCPWLMWPDLSTFLCPYYVYALRGAA
jgi:hypothetical protein